jgi:hypothetical protein
MSILFFFNCRYWFHANEKMALNQKNVNYAADTLCKDPLRSIPLNSLPRWAVSNLCDDNNNIIYLVFLVGCCESSGTSELELNSLVRILRRRL